MCHPGKATTRAHGQQMSSGLIVRLRAGPGLLGTVEQRHRTARQGGRYKPFSREIAIWAVWAGDKNAALDGPPRARFIGDYPVSFAFCRIPSRTSALSEYEEDPMLTSPSTRFHTLRSAYCNLKGFEGVNWRGNGPCASPPARHGVFDGLFDGHRTQTTPKRSEAHRPRSWRLAVTRKLLPLKVAVRTFLAI